MTLIVSWIDKKGAHICGDSRLMYEGKPFDENNKLISLLNGRILIGIAGSWGINQNPVPSYIRDIIPDFHEEDLESKEEYIQKFAEIFACRIGADIKTWEVQQQGVRFSVIIQNKAQFVVHAIDVEIILPNPHVLSQVFRTYKIIPSILYNGIGPYYISRGHSFAEQAFNENVKLEKTTSHPDILREIIRQKLYEDVIGGSVFSLHRLNNSTIDCLINNVCNLAEIESHKSIVTKIINVIADEGFDITISNVKEGQEGSETKISWDNYQLKLNVNSESKGLNTLWDLFHEYGHIIDKRPQAGEEKSLKRELSAWIHAYDHMKQFNLSEHRDSFILRCNVCMHTYYLNSLEKNHGN